LNNSGFHKKFKLQGKSFESSKDLIDFSKEFSVEVAFFLEQWFDSNNYIEVSTSGSTGKPTIIQLLKKQMLNSAIATGSYFNLPKKTTALLCMPPNYIAGKMMLVRALTLGWELDVVEPSSTPLKNCIKRYDFSAMVPLQLSNSLTEIHNIKQLIVGGGVVSKELVATIQELQTEIFATYGMTETITHIAVKKLNNLRLDSVLNKKIPNQVENDVRFRHAELVSASHYKTLPNIKISIDDRGCLIIDAPNVANEICITNDLVELISDTEFKWLGRYDTIINSGGIKLIPEQIEAKLAAIVVQRFFVTGIPDTLLGEKLILVIEGENTLNKDTILNKMKNLNSLLKYETPKEIYFVGKFVETETKKVNRLETTKLL